MYEICLSVISFLNKLELICLHFAFVSKQLNGFYYCYQTLIILFLFTQPLRSGRIWHKVSF